MRCLAVVLVVCSVVVLTGYGDAPVAPAPAPAFKPVADMRSLMNGLIDPAADVIWESVSITITREGTDERAPSTVDEWQALRDAALVLAESGNLLMMEGRAIDNDDWPRASRSMTEVALGVITAVEAQNPDEIMTVGGRLYDTCVNCHVRYLGPT